MHALWPLRSSAMVTDCRLAARTTTSSSGICALSGSPVARSRRSAISWASPSTVRTCSFNLPLHPLTPPAENAVSGDASAQVPGGIRLGTSALTSRDMREDDIKVVADFLHRAVQLSLLLQKEAGSKLLKDFVRVATVPAEGKEGFQLVKQLRSEVEEFAMKWPLPGVDVSTLTKPEGLHE